MRKRSPDSAYHYYCPPGSHFRSHARRRGKLVNSRAFEYRRIPLTLQWVTPRMHVTLIAQMRLRAYADVLWSQRRYFINVEWLRDHSSHRAFEAAREGAIEDQKVYGKLLLWGFTLHV